MGRDLSNKRIIELAKARDQIQREGPPSSSQRSFQARHLVQATLPHSNPGDVRIFTRSNGNYTVSIQPHINHKTGQSIGYPYGVIPRLVLFWITREAVLKKTRQLDAGNNMANWMRQVGLDPDTGGGKRGDAYRLKLQMNRLFRAKVSFDREVIAGEQAGAAWLDMQIASGGVMWWDHRNPEQDSLGNYHITLSESFYAAITEAPVPVDARHLAALKSSPLKLDLYALATYAQFIAWRSGRPQQLDYRDMQSQLGCSNKKSSHRRFKQLVREYLKEVCFIYPDLKVEENEKGTKLIVKPDGKPAVLPSQMKLL